MTKKEMWMFSAGVAIWLAVTVLFIGFRPEHLLLAALMLSLFFASRCTRRLCVALIPFFIFGISYDWMNLLPNYEVNSVDVEGLYNAEKSLFGINMTELGLLTPNEFLARHTSPLADFLAGLFYLCWVPVPVVFGLWLFFTGHNSLYLHFAIAFLLVNVIGFAIYYIHPAAPPWYVSSHGMIAIPGTRGETAGLANFDSMTGLGIFKALYTRNSNVFAAMPSLHSAYTFTAFIYALRGKSPLAWQIALGFITLGIWCSAVYTSHHYILDVICGIALTIVTFFVFEYILMRIPAVKRFMGAYTLYIS